MGYCPNARRGGSTVRRCHQCCRCSPAWEPNGAAVANPSLDIEAVIPYADTAMAVSSQETI